MTAGAVAIHWWPVLLEAFGSGKAAAAFAAVQPVDLVFPAVVFSCSAFIVARDQGVLGGDPTKLSYQEEAVLAADRAYLERMKRKKRGEKDDNERGYIDIETAGRGYGDWVRSNLGLARGRTREEPK